MTKQPYVNKQYERWKRNKVGIKATLYVMAYIDESGNISEEDHIEAIHKISLAIIGIRNDDPQAKIEVVSQQLSEHWSAELTDRYNHLKTRFNVTIYYPKA